MATETLVETTFMAALVNPHATGVVIVHYGSAANVLECVMSLATMGKEAKNFHLIIVNNAAKEPLDESTLQTRYPGEITFLTAPTNLGFTGGNNLGMQWALNHLTSDALILLNDDTTVQPTTLPKLIQRLQQEKTAGAVTPKIYFTAGREFHEGYEKSDEGKVIWYAGGQIDWVELTGFHRGVDEVDRGQFDQLQTTPFATGCCVAYRTSALRKIGVLDDAYFLYFEDADLSLRLRAARYQILYEPTAVMWHKNAGSSSSGSDIHRYYLTRNRYRFGFTYAPLRTRLFLLKHLLIQYRDGDKVIRQAILDVLRNRYGIYRSIHH